LTLSGENVNLDKAAKWRLKMAAQYTITTGWHRDGFHVKLEDANGNRRVHYHSFTMDTQAKQLAEKIKEAINQNPSWVPEEKYWTLTYYTSPSVYPCHYADDDSDDDSDDDWEDDSDDEWEDDECDSSEEWDER